MSQQTVKAMLGLYDAFNRGDLDTIEKGYSPNISWKAAENSFYAGGSPYRGFPAIRDNVFTPVTTEFEGFRCDIEETFDAGDTVVVTGRYRGKSVETGKETSNQFCHVMHVDADGKVDRFQEYADTLQIAEATGRAKPIERAERREPLPA